MSNPAEKALQASLWLQLPLLLSTKEMNELLSILNGCLFYLVGKVARAKDLVTTKEGFADAYHSYLTTLVEKQDPHPPSLYQLQGAFSCRNEDFIEQTVPDGRALLRIIQPVIQVQPYGISYSSLEKKFYGKIFGKQSITWGLLFSYPQLYLNQKSGQPEKTLENPSLPNGALFKKVQKWARLHTRPSHFLVEGEKKTLPARIGKECFSWIHLHPQLQEQGISIIGSIPKHIEK